MRTFQKQDYADARFIPSALAAWFISAPIFLAAAAAAVNGAELGGGSIGYISSLVSFLAAVAAGAAAGRVRRAGTIYTAAVSAAAITTLLLTIGFIAAGTELEAAGVLSVVSFTFSGCLVGCVFFGRRKRKGGKHRRAKFT